jgi:hypothetical protein
MQGSGRANEEPRFRNRKEGGLYMRPAVSESRCVNEHADAERLVEWINDPQRKPAYLAFTEGPERQVAYAVEGLLRR